MSGIPPPPLPPSFLTLQIRQDSRLVISPNENCGNYNTNLLNKFVKRTITDVRPVAQSGPNCGLAALAMAATVTPSHLTVSEIFEEAKSKGFTKNGEMFSVSNMKLLAEGVLSPWFQVEIFSDGLAVNKHFVIDSLYDGALMLIPYDADKDHSPCCKNGHKAHWALVCGIMADNDGEVYIAARHGKSRYMAVWLLERLQKSNDNLTELDPSRANDDKEYVIPEGGVKAGLASQFIVLRRKNT